MQQDYILRMVQQFTSVMTRVLRLRRDGRTDEALEELSDAYGILVGLPGSLVHVLSDDDLVVLLRAQGRLDLDRCLGLATLLREEALTYEAAGDEVESFPRYAKALRLFLEVATTDDEVVSAQIPGLDQTIEALDGFDLPPATSALLIDYLEAAGRFDDAENALLQRLDAMQDDPEVRVAAIAFYQRLSGLSDAALIAGGLTRDEVSEALARIGDED